MNTPPGPADGTTTASASKVRLAVALSTVALGVGAAYWNVLVKLVDDWQTNENYSHGFLIPPLAAYLTWERRHRLAATPMRPALSGLLIVLLGVGLLSGATLGAEVFLARVSLLIVLAGSTVFLAGSAHLRVIAFPLSILLLMIPIPMIISNHITLPLQLIASQGGESALRAIGIPVLREGNVITLANATLEVAEACSGIRSLVSLLTLSIVYGYFSERRRSIRVVLALSTLPIAIVTNALRVAAIGVAAYFWGPDAAEGPFHTISGWLVFVLAFALLVLSHSVCQLLRRVDPSTQSEMAVA